MVRELEAVAINRMRKHARITFRLLFVFIDWLQFYGRLSASTPVKCYLWRTQCVIGYAHRFVRPPSSVVCAKFRLLAICVFGEWGCSGGLSFHLPVNIYLTPVPNAPPAQFCTSCGCGRNQQSTPRSIAVRLLSVCNRQSILNPLCLPLVPFSTVAEVYQPHGLRSAL